MFRPHTAQATCVLFHCDGTVSPHYDTGVGTSSRFIDTVSLMTTQQEDRLLEPGSDAVVAGWGADESGDQSRLLLSAVVPIVSQRVCED